MDGVSKHAFLRPAWQGLWAAGGRGAGSSHGWAGRRAGRQAGGPPRTAKPRPRMEQLLPSPWRRRPNNEQPEMQHGRRAPRAPRSRRPHTSTRAPARTCTRTRTRSPGLPAGEKQGCRVRGGPGQGEGRRGREGRARGSQLRCFKVEQNSYHLILAKNTFLKTSQLFRGSRGALDSYVTGELKGVSNYQEASGNQSPVLREGSLREPDGALGPRNLEERLFKWT